MEARQLSCTFHPLPLSHMGSHHERLATAEHRLQLNSQHIHIPSIWGFAKLCMMQYDISTMFDMLLNSCDAVGKLPYGHLCKISDLFKLKTWTVWADFC